MIILKAKQSGFFLYEMVHLNYKRFSQMRSCSLVDAVANLGEGPGGPPSFFSDQTEAWRAEKNVLETAPALSQGLNEGEGLDAPQRYLNPDLNDTTKQESFV